MGLMTDDVTREISIDSRRSKTRFQVVYADTDTLSSFLNRNCFNFFMKEFETLGAEIIIPKMVLNELYHDDKRTGIRTEPIKQMIRAKRIFEEDIDPFSDKADTYYELCEIMDAGEASALTLAKHSDRIAVVASNNMSDIARYARKNDIELWPTARILQEAVDLKIMNMDQADDLWKKMKKDGLRLPLDETFKAYYERNVLIENKIRKEVS